MSHIATETRAPDQPDQLVGEAEAAILLGLAPRTLSSWRQRGIGPRYIRVSARSIRYRRSDVLAWIAEHEMRRTREHAGG